LENAKRAVGIFDTAEDLNKPLRSRKKILVPFAVESALSGVEKK